MRLSRQSDRNIPQTKVTKGFSTASNLMGHKMAGCLLVKLFAMHTTYFCGIFAILGKKRKAEDEQRFRNEKHVADWILVVSSILTWYQWMKQPTISKRQVKGSHEAVQWLMRFISTVTPCIDGMTNNTIKIHLVLHLCEGILNHGVPDNVNSAYAELAHITLAKVTSQITQKRAISFTMQAAHRYLEDLDVSFASADVKNDIKLKGASFAPLGTHGTTTSPTPEIQLSGGKSGRDLSIQGLLAMNPLPSSGKARDLQMIWRWSISCVELQHSWPIIAAPDAQPMARSCASHPSLMQMVNGTVPIPAVTMAKFGMIAESSSGKAFLSFSSLHLHVCKPLRTSKRKTD
jgi:hypothetical protein